MPIQGVGARRARRLLGLTALFAAAVVAIAVATSAADGRRPVALVEGSGCDQPPITAQPAVPGPTLTADGAAVPVVLFIPPTTFVRVDADGAPEHVTTNTGCAPRPSDRFLIEIDGGPDAVGAPSELVEEVMAPSFTGDWREEGRWHEV